MELRGKKPPSPPIIIDILSREYGWTISEIKGLTYSELFIYMEIIKYRNKANGGKRT